MFPVKKRKADSASPAPRKPDTDSPALKKAKVEPTLSPSSSSASLARYGHTGKAGVIVETLLVFYLAYVFKSYWKI